MSRACSFLLGLAALLASSAGVLGEEPKTPRTDLYGDPLPPGAVARLGTTRLRHAAAQVAFSADGKRLLSCDNRGDVRIWEAATGKRLEKNQLSWIRSDDKRFEILALSSNGATAVGLDGHVVYLYDTNSGKERGRIPCINAPQYWGSVLLTFSPDGKLLAVQTAGEKQEFNTQIWDVATIKKRQTLKTPPDIRLSSVAFTWVGKRLAGIAPKSDGSGKLGGALFDLVLWDVTTGKLICKRENLRQMDADSLAFSPDDKTLAVGGHREHVVRLLDADTLKEKARLKPPASASPDAFVHLAFSPDGRRLAAAYGTDPNPGPVDRGVLLWELTGAARVRRLPGRSAYDSLHVAFAPDGKTLAAHDNSPAEIRLWDTISGEPLHHRPGHDARVTAMAVSPNGKLIVSGDFNDGDVILHLWDVATSKQLRVLESRHFKINSVLSCSPPYTFSPDGKWIVSIGRTAGADGETTALQVWDVATGKALRRIEMMQEEGVPLHAPAISADGKRLAAVVGSVDESPSPQLIVWDLDTGKRLSQRPYKLEVRVPDKSDRNSPPRGVDAPRTTIHAAFAPDGDSVTVWRGDRVGIVESSTGCLLAMLSKGAGRPLVFSPDGRFLAAAVRQPAEYDPQHDEFKGLALIEAASGEEVVRLELESFYDVAFIPDSRGVIVTDKERLHVWDTATGKKLYEGKLPKAFAEEDRLLWPPLPLVMLPNGRMAAGMSAGDILIWDLLPSTWLVRQPACELSAAKLNALWSDLAGDAPKAHRAVHQMAAAPAQAVPFLKDHLQPATVAAKRVEKLLADLDGDSFSARKAAVRELARLHYRVEPMLRKALEGKPSLEARRRIEAILAGPKTPLAEDLQRLRALAVLERIGTPEARRILEKLAGGAAARETREARAALQRLKRR